MRFVGIRDLLFLGLVGGGLASLAVSLMPPRQPTPILSHDIASYHADDFRDIVGRLDATFVSEWAKHDITPTDAASPLAVMRRLALGLMGTIPSLDEIRQFESLPHDEQLPWWIDHILQDRRSADYLAERFARAYVGAEGGPFLFYRRRRFIDWLAEQIHGRRPYDEIVRDLLTTRGLWTDQPAVNFVSVTSQQDKENQPDPVRLAGRVTRAFLGLRLDCAQCHDHPFKDWTQGDFEGLTAFFGQTRLGFTGIYDGDGEYETKDRKTGESRVVAPTIFYSPELMPDEGDRRQRLAAWVTHPRNKNFSRAVVNRVWAVMFGQPLVEPIDNLEFEDEFPPALDLLAADFVEHGFDLHRLIRVIARSRVYQLDSASEREMTIDDQKAWAVYPMSRLRPEQVVGGVIQASSITTIDRDSHLLTRLIRLANQNDFLTRYGDNGEDEFDGRGGTIPQRLLMMNGSLIRERIESGPFTATTRIAHLAKSNPRAVEVAYLTVLTRRPTALEAEHFEALLADPKADRPQILEDMYWVLVNSTEFSWNH